MALEEQGWPHMDKLGWTASPQRQADKRNTPVTEHTATELGQHGEGLRQTQKNNMHSDKAEPGDSPR